MGSQVSQEDGEYTSHIHHQGQDQHLSILKYLNSILKIMICKPLLSSLYSEDLAFTLIIVVPLQITLFKLMVVLHS